jgi:uncharacterized protein with GYD domain
MKHQLKELTKVVGKKYQHIKMTVGTYRVNILPCSQFLVKGKIRIDLQSLNKEQVRTKVMHAFIFRYYINQHPK